MHIGMLFKVSDLLRGAECHVYVQFPNAYAIPKDQVVKVADPEAEAAAFLSDLRHDLLL